MSYYKKCPICKRSFIEARQYAKHFHKGTKCWTEVEKIVTAETISLGDMK